MLGCLLVLVGCAWAGQDEADLELQVRGLVRQLEAPQLALREQAEEKLLKMGPAILERLPQVTERTPAETKQRLGRIRQKLQQAAAESAAQPSTVTLAGQAMPLSKVLAALEQQSGNKIVDYRARFGHPVTDPELKVELNRTPFWQALDQVLDQAGLTLYAFGEERALYVVGRGETKLSRCGAACYSGPFRFEPLSVMAQRDLRQPGSGSLHVKLQVAWEPRLKPIGLKQRMADLKAADERGNPLTVDDRQAELEVPAVGVTAVEMSLPLALPSRDVKQIASLSSRLLAMLPGKVETFRFGDLDKANSAEQRIAGVTVTLEQVRRNNELWEVRIRVRFDEAGDALASHRGWIFQNEAYLEGPDGKPIAYDSLETTRQAKNEVGVAYLFVLPGPLGGHKFVYKTPGVIIATGLDYQLKGIQLP